MARAQANNNIVVQRSGPSTALASPFKAVPVSRTLHLPSKTTKILGPIAPGRVQKPEARTKAQATAKPVAAQNVVSDLHNFCKKQHLPKPVFVSKEAKVGTGVIKYVGSVTVGARVWHTPRHHGSIKEARYDVCAVALEDLKDGTNKQKPKSQAKELVTVKEEDGFDCWDKILRDEPNLRKLSPISRSNIGLRVCPCTFAFDGRRAIT